MKLIKLIVAVTIGLTCMTSFATSECPRGSKRCPPILPVLKTENCSIYAEFMGKNGKHPFYFVNSLQKKAGQCKSEFNTGAGGNYQAIVKSVCKDMSNYLGGGITYYLKYEVNGKLQSPIFGDWTCM